MAQEKRDIIRMEQRHQIAKATADVARKTAMLGDLNDPFTNNTHVEILRSTEKDIILLEAQNRHALIGSDINGSEIDLTTTGPEKDWGSIVDRIDIIAGNASSHEASASASKKNEEPVMTMK
ncbi:hypothetical protein ACFL47_02665 [Candidatus Latescibacterota bacterium]